MAHDDSGKNYAPVIMDTKEAAHKYLWHSWKPDNWGLTRWLPNCGDGPITFMGQGWAGKAKTNPMLKDSRRK
jgi:hypothetical protein